MEPGHEDREYQPTCHRRSRSNTASMEPGHEDREYPVLWVSPKGVLDASMEPGHEDREYFRAVVVDELSQ